MYCTSSIKIPGNANVLGYFGFTNASGRPNILITTWTLFGVQEPELLGCRLELVSDSRNEICVRVYYVNHSAPRTD